MKVLVRWKIEDGHGFQSEQVELTGTMTTVDVAQTKLDEFILAGQSPTYISVTALEDEHAP